MSATNATTYYELPVFIATDKPAWLTDWNGAMSAIDTAIKEALTAGENAQTTANTATSNISTINDSLTTINTSLTTLTSAVTGLTGSVNTINSLIGNGEPTTTDKTLIGAINEIYGMITGGGGGAEIQAQNVVYDNTTSGLTATSVQGAIDELHDADAIAYDNNTSGLTATDVQSAIDEIAQGGSGSDLDLSAHTGTATLTPASGITLAPQYNSIDYNFNDDYSIGTINGALFIQGTLGPYQDWTEVVDIDCGLPARTTEKAINLGLIYGHTSNGISSIGLRIKVKTNGHIAVELNYGQSGTDYIGLSVIPFLMFLAE